MARHEHPDTFKGTVYHLSESNVFITVDRDRQPTEEDFVVVGRDDNGALAFERYGYQQHYGVVNVLDFIALDHSTQWTPLAC